MGRWGKGKGTGVHTPLGGTFYTGRPFRTDPETYRPETPTQWWCESTPDSQFAFNNMAPLRAIRGELPSTKHCLICSSTEHPIVRCPRSPPDKIRILRALNVCVNCLTPGHSERDCKLCKLPDFYPCSQCGARHYDYIFHFPRNWFVSRQLQDYFDDMPNHPLSTYNRWSKRVPPFANKCTATEQPPPPPPTVFKPPYGPNRTNNNNNNINNNIINNNNNNNRTQSKQPLLDEYSELERIVVEDDFEDLDGSLAHLPEYAKWKQANFALRRSPRFGLEFPESEGF